MIDKLIFQELTDAEAANLTGGVQVQATVTTDAEGETVLLADTNGDGVLESFEGDEPDGAGD